MRQKQYRKTAVRSRGLVSASTTKDGCDSVGAACADLPGSEAPAACAYRRRG